MASVLVLSETGRTLPVASRLKNEGHITKVWFRNGVEGILAGSRNPSRVKNPAVLLEQFDLIVSEGTLGSQVVDIEKMGKRVIGCNTVTEKMIKDKDYFSRVLAFLGLETPPLLGIPVQVTGYMGPKGFNTAITLTLASTRFMDKDKGLDTQGMGSLVVYISEDTKLAKALLPFEAFLLKIRYIGPFTLNMQLKGDLWNITSVDTDLIPESTLAGAELLTTSLFDFLFGLPEDKSGTAWAGVGISVVTSLPPWPYLLKGVEFTLTGNPIDVPEKAVKHFSLGDRKLGLLGIATAKGADVREARRRVYRTVNNSVKNPVVQYRDDIGVAQEKDLQTLKEWGWI